MNEQFAKLNYLNSSSIEDVKHFSALTASTYNLPKDVLTTYTHISPGDFKNADAWEYPQFDYVLNHLGFRNDNIPKQSDLAIFGCSFTFGTGLPVDMLWHTLLANKLNTKSDNYGMPGASIKSIIDVALIVNNHTHINRAVFLLPAYNRMQIAKTSPLAEENNNVNYVSVIPNHKSSLSEAYSIDADLLLRAIPDEEMYKNMRDSLYLVDYIFKQKNIKTYYSSWDPETYSFLSQMELQGTVLPEWTSKGLEQASTDLARDKLHPGPEHQIQFVNKIIDYIK